MVTTNKSQIATVAILIVASLVFQQAALGTSHNDVKLGTPFTIQVGKTVQIRSENLALTLVDVLDSRCPSDVVCIWEGEVILTLNVKKGGDKSKETSLEIQTSKNSKISYDNFSIELSKVEPYPNSEKEIKKEEYMVTLIINKKIIPTLKQFKSGISIDEIKCKETLVLVQKNNGKPACVKPETVEKLIARGWALDRSSINSFEECAAAGNPVMESYPRQCRTSDGKHFVEEIDSKMMSPESLCQKYGGNWLEEFSECEFISAEQCSEMNGMYKECESACRNMPDAEVCIAMCVPVCYVP